MAARKKRVTKKQAGAGSIGLSPAEMADPDTPPETLALSVSVRSAGGVPLASYRDPVGGHWLLLAAQPVERVAATPYQRDLSDPHVKRLESVIERVGTFLDPVIAVVVPEADALLDHMEEKAAAFNLDKVKGEQVAKAAGSGEG